MGSICFIEEKLQHCVEFLKLNTLNPNKSKQKQSKAKQNFWLTTNLIKTKILVLKNIDLQKSTSLAVQGALAHRL